MFYILAGQHDFKIKHEKTPTTHSHRAYVNATTNNRPEVSLLEAWLEMSLGTYRPETLIIIPMFFTSDDNARNESLIICLNTSLLQRSLSGADYVNFTHKQMEGGEHEQGYFFNSMESHTMS